MMTVAKAKLRQARVALDGCPISDVRHLNVEQTGESLVISGHVSSFYHKQIAQEAIRAACRGVAVVNDVAVARPR
jgi:hypothetical protein